MLDLAPSVHRPCPIDLCLCKYQQLLHAYLIFLLILPDTHVQPRWKFSDLGLFVSVRNGPLPHLAGSSICPNAFLSSI